MSKATPEQEQVIKELLNGVNHYPKYVPRWISILFQRAEVRNQIILNEIKQIKQYFGFNVDNEDSSNKEENISSGQIKIGHSSELTNNNHSNRLV